MASAGPLGADQRPPHLRPTDASAEEAGLWYMSDKAEAQAKVSGELDSDAGLTAYVRSVECKVASEYCDDVRIYVMDRPYFNATTAPNGYIEVWTGPLLRVRDEAELAFVLGHETSHFALNHSVQSQKEERRRMNEAMALGLVLAAGGMAAGISLGASPSSISNLGSSLVNVAYLGEMAGFMRFNREQEDIADQAGLDRIVAAGYEPSASTSVWRSLVSEQASSDFPKVRQQHARANIFDDHPLEGQRIDALTALASGRPSGDRGRERYRAAIRPHLAAFLRDDLRRRDFGETLYTANRLLADGGDEGVLNYFRGECYRQRRGDGDAAQALTAYQAATLSADAPPEAWREVGTLYQSQHQIAKARTAFQTYLDRAPAAQDRWLVEASLKKLNQMEAS